MRASPAGKLEGESSAQPSATAPQSSSAAGAPGERRRAPRRSWALRGRSRGRAEGTGARGGRRRRRPRPRRRRCCCRRRRGLRIPTLHAPRRRLYTAAAAKGPKGPARASPSLPNPAARRARQPPSLHVSPAAAAAPAPPGRGRSRTRKPRSRRATPLARASARPHHQRRRGGVFVPQAPPRPWSLRARTPLLRPAYVRPSTESAQALRLGVRLLLLRVHPSAALAAPGGGKSPPGSGA